MFKKNLLLVCALAAAYAPATQGKSSCCNCRSLTVSGSGSITGSLSVGGSETVGGSLTVTGPVTGASFSTPTGGLLFNGLRNWAVFSNTSLVLNAATVPFAATLPASVSAGITNTAGNITLPVGGTFLVMYTVRFAVAAGAAGFASAQLQQTAASVFGPIAQPAVIDTLDTLPLAAGDDITSQVSGYAIVTTTTTANNQINLLIALDAFFTVPITAGDDANAQLTILQLN